MIDIWLTLRVLQHHHPLDGPVQVLVTEMEEEGSYDEADGTHVIRIANHVPESGRSEVLIHEYAHALLQGYSGPGYDMIWGACYGGLYRLIFGEH